MVAKVSWKNRMLARAGALAMLVAFMPQFCFAEEGPSAHELAPSTAALAPAVAGYASAEGPGLAALLACDAPAGNVFAYVACDDGLELAKVAAVPAGALPAGTSSLVEQAVSNTGLAAQDDGAVEYVYEPGSGLGSAVSIPAEVGGKPVTSIGAKAFEGQTWLRTVDIPASVSKIGEAAFRGCSSLESVAVPPGCQLGSRAFYGCASLARVDLPEGVILGYRYEIERDDGYERYDQQTGESIWVAVPHIDTWVDESSYVFGYCDSLVDISLPSSVTVVPADTFEGCSSLRRVSLPEGLTEIGPWAFGNCSALAWFSLPSSLKVLGPYAFYGCNPAETVVIPAALETIGESAFGNWTGDGYWEYGEADGERTWVAETRFYIQTSTWEQYWKLQGDSGYSNVGSTNIVPPYEGEGPVGFTWELNDEGFAIITGAKGQIPSNLVIPSELDLAASDASQQGSEAGRCMVEEIGEGAFRGASAIRTVALPETLKRIRAGAFAGCSSLESVYIPGGDTVIEAGAFDAPGKGASPDLVIACKSGSKASVYAWSNRIATTSAAPLSLATVEVEDELAYGSDPALLHVVVKLGDRELVAGSDYELTFGPKANAGARGAITVAAVEGSGYSGEQYGSYAVVPADLSGAKVSAVNTQVLRGDSVQPRPSVTVGGAVLREGVDFAYAWSGNDAPGIGRVMVEGCGNYSGTVSTAFLVVEPEPMPAPDDSSSGGSTGSEASDEPSVPPEAPSGGEAGESGGGSGSSGGQSGAPSENDGAGAQGPADSGSASGTPGTSSGEPSPDTPGQTTGQPSQPAQTEGPPAEDTAADSGQGQSATKPDDAAEGPGQPSSDGSGTHSGGSSAGDAADGSGKPVSDGGTTNGGKADGEVTGGAGADGSSPDDVAPGGGEPGGQAAQPGQTGGSPSEAGGAAGQSSAPSAASPGQATVRMAAPATGGASRLQSVTFKAKAKKLKAKKLKKKSVSFKIRAKASQGGKLSFTLDKKAKKAKMKVTKKGKVTVRKGTKRGTYRIIVRAAAIGSFGPAKASFTIKVR